MTWQEALDAVIIGLTISILGTVFVCIAFVVWLITRRPRRREEQHDGKR